MVEAKEVIVMAREVKIRSVAKYGTKKECRDYMKRHPDLKKRGYKVIKPFGSWIVAR